MVLLIGAEHIGLRPTIDGCDRAWAQDRKKGSKVVVVIRLEG